MRRYLRRSYHREPCSQGSSPRAHMPSKYASDVAAPPMGRPVTAGPSRRRRACGRARRDARRGRRRGRARPGKIWVTNAAAAARLSGPVGRVELEPVEAAGEGSVPPHLSPDGDAPERAAPERPAASRPARATARWSGCPSCSQGTISVVAGEQHSVARASARSAARDARSPSGSPRRTTRGAMPRIAKADARSSARRRTSSSRTDGRGAGVRCLAVGACRRS